MGTGEVAERVGGEVAEASQRPVNVLEAALGIVGNFQTEEFLKQILPGSRKVFDFEIPPR